MNTDEIVIEFSAEQIDSLRKDFDFSKSYQLEAELRRIAIFFEKPGYYKNHPPNSQQKKLFNAIYQSAVKLEDSALKLEEAMENLGEAELMLIGKHDMAWVHDDKLEAISHIKYIAGYALADLEEASLGGKKRPTRNKQALIRRLAFIYENGTGKNDKYTQPPETNIYKSNRVRFIEQIVEILNVPIDNRYIGETLKEFFRNTP